MKLATKMFLSVLVIIVALLAVEIARSPDKNSVQIFFLNVGQGDAELIQQGNYQILIDGGPDDSILAELGKAMPITDRTIEMVILTHPHADHLTGLNQVLERYQIGHIYFSGSITTSNTYLEFLNMVKKYTIVTKIPTVGEKIVPFDNGDLTFLWPGDKYIDRSIENLNDTSEVIKLCYFAECAVFLGDQEIEEQKMMFLELENRKIDYSGSILKISHHGSTNGTDQTTLERVKPLYAVIEVGADNKFGHPHAAVIDLLNNVGINTYRTDRDGTVEFKLRKNAIEIK